MAPLPCQLFHNSFTGHGPLSSCPLDPFAETDCSPKPSFWDTYDNHSFHSKNLMGISEGSKNSIPRICYPSSHPQHLPVVERSGNPPRRWTILAAFHLHSKIPIGPPPSYAQCQGLMGMDEGIRMIFAAQTSINPSTNINMEYIFNNVCVEDNDCDSNKF